MTSHESCRQGAHSRFRTHFCQLTLYFHVQTKRMNGIVYNKSIGGRGSSECAGFSQSAVFWCWRRNFLFLPPTLLDLVDWKGHELWLTPIYFGAFWRGANASSSHKISSVASPSANTANQHITWALAMRIAVSGMVLLSALLGGRHLVHSFTSNTVVRRRTLALSAKGERRLLTCFR